MNIYTKTGDDGTTGLFGGRRVGKDEIRLHAYGTIDELNSSLGAALCEAGDERTKEIVISLQHLLFTTGADLATPLEAVSAGKTIARIASSDVTGVEALIDEISAAVPPLKNFILPGGTKCASQLHVARTVCRRAERYIAALMKQEQVKDELLIFVNRISDLLFVLARYENFKSGIPDTTWETTRG
jgi:cob(I)alamin adenosyltransferase